jgi:hypothetical protein
MMKHRSRFTRLLLCLLVLVVLVLALGSAQAIPPPPKPKPCPGDEGNICVANMSVVTVCVEVASPAYCGAPVKVKLFPRDDS